MTAEPIRQINNQCMLLGLDYELFFGQKSGTVENCMIKPTEKLIKILNKYQAKVSLFVDAGFLLKLKSESESHPKLRREWNQIESQLRQLSEQGHDLQLHIHPHWEDCFYTGKQWVIKTDRYRLHDFSIAVMSSLVRRYKSILEELSSKPVFAYRAGGWCIQPFTQIKTALAENGIWLDSTLFENGHSSDPVRWFHFFNLPKKSYWRFSDDPGCENDRGEFVELPISSYPVSALFYWKMAAKKLLVRAQSEYAPYGDGGAMKAGNQYYLSRLFKSVASPVSIDGIKAGLLEKAYDRHQKGHPSGVFNVMGHPKSLTDYSLARLDTFLKKNPTIRVITFQDVDYLRPSNTNVQRMMA